MKLLLLLIIIMIILIILLIKQGPSGARCRRAAGAQPAATRGRLVLFVFLVCSFFSNSIFFLFFICFFWFLVCFSCHQHVLPFYSCLVFFLFVYTFFDVFRSNERSPIETVLEAPVPERSALVKKKVSLVKYMLVWTMYSLHVQLFVCQNSFQVEVLPKRFRAYGAPEAAQRVDPHGPPPGGFQQSIVWYSIV